MFIYLQLFDLVIMGFKLQWVSCRTPIDLINVTNNHLKSILALTGKTTYINNMDQEFRHVNVESNDECRELVQNATKLIISFYSEMNEGLCH